MNITILLPSQALRPYVDRFLVISCNDANDITFKMVPRGNPCFIFTSPCMETIGNCMNGRQFDYAAGDVYFGGNGCEPVVIRIPARAHFIVALLNPHCAGQFFREDAIHFTTGCYSVSCITKMKIDLNQQIWNEESNECKIRLIEKFLFQLIRKNGASCSHTKQAIDLIFAAGGCISADDLAKQTYTCPRNLRRKFDQHVGLSPKKFIDLIRFNSFMKDALLHPETSLESLSMQHNYYDLSHLNKDFIRYIGDAPRECLLQNQVVNYSLLFS